MKKTIRNIGSATFIGAMLIASHTPLAAQTAVESTTTTKTTTSAGTISEFSPETIVVRTEASSDPVRYTYTKTTTYVDETGAPVSMALVKSGLPVTVYYTRDGDRMVASKVIVRKVSAVVTPVVTPVTVPVAPPVIEEKKTSTTTTTTDK